jgi:hypothetical protein
MALLTQKPRFNEATKRKYASIYEKIPFKISKNIVFELKTAVLPVNSYVFFQNFVAFNVRCAIIKLKSKQ